MKVYKAIFILLFGIFISNPINAKIYAVCVGVSEYEESYNNLRFCAQDAIEMYNLLKLQTSTDNLKLLTNGNATVANIIYHTSLLFEKSNPGDIVIFFFSGHGNKGEFCAHDGDLDFSILKDIFKKTKAKRKMIFADACFSGSLRTENSSSSNSASALDSNVLLFLSSRTRQTSQEQQSLRNGAFTYYLIAGLKGGADANKDRKITAKELFDFVYPKVKAQTKGMQVPVMWGKFDNDMLILSWKKK